MTIKELPNGYSYIKATKEHSIVAQNIIFSVLKEYNFTPDLKKADVDLVDIEDYYKEGFFGLIINDLNAFVGAFGLHPLKGEVCKIRKMYLLPEARGKGLGKWMLTFMIHLYKAFGFQQYISENATPACDLVFYKDLDH